MRPQDIVILLKIILLGEESWLLKDLSNSLHISYSEISESLDRSVYAGLLDHNKRRVNSTNLMDFIFHGLKYVFPTQPGTIARGIPTAHSHPFMQQYFPATNLYVWPSLNGTVMGQIIDPFYPNQVLAVEGDEELYILLALIDVLRVGKIREINIAKDEIKKCIERSKHVKSY